MNRREALVALGALTVSGMKGAEDAGAELPGFWKSRLAEVETAVKNVRKGETRLLTKSAGHRDIYLITYGQRQFRQATANYNSACGGRAPAAYARKDGNQQPVIFLLGPVHGGELEGIVGLINLLHIAETGNDHRGRPWLQLADNVSKCRVLVVPSGNPDGRDRFPIDSSVAHSLDERQAFEMGVRPDGTRHKWPEVKRVHPMRGPSVGRLGAYFNDDGINLMHDEWFHAMAPETDAYLKLARVEAPDFIVSLHSHASRPSVEPTHYVPRTIKETIWNFSDRLQKRYAHAGLPHRQNGPEPQEDGTSFPPPSLNLCSALHHTCGAAAFVHECCVGVKDDPYPKLTHEQILDLQLLLYDELFKFALENPVNWVRS